jgi:hypothetical protein
MLVLKGSTANFKVQYDDQLVTHGIDGPALADAELARCEADFATLSAWFGGITPPAADMPILIDILWNNGAGGGWTNGHNYIAVNAIPTSQGININEISLAELGEIFMEAQGRGWYRASSNGEALSRILPPALYAATDPNAYLNWEGASDWLNGPRADWVTNTYPSDADRPSLGCGMLFLYYLHGQLNFLWPQIIQAAAPTLEGVAENLGLQNAWADFIALVNAHWPPGTPVALQSDNVFPFSMPQLYLRHNLADDGTSHTGMLSRSPDIIVRSAPVADPQTTFSTAASIANDMESDPAVVTGQPNRVYLRVWNRGTDGTNVTATAYWSPPATLVTPNMWTLIGQANYPDVPPGSQVQVSAPGIMWDTVPAPGHYCFIATVGNAAEPAPAPNAFADFDHFMNYVYAHNNLTWRNFNVVPFGFDKRIVHVPFAIPGAWDKARLFEFDVRVRLAEGSHVALEVPGWLTEGLHLGRKDAAEVKDGNETLVSLPLPTNFVGKLGKMELPAGVSAKCRLAVAIPHVPAGAIQEVSVGQLYRGRRAGLLTYRFVPEDQLEKTR